MEEIKVGDYVRTKEGEIIKVREDYNIFTDDDGLFIDAYMLPYEQKIIKHSSNIIDLIEVGDYVNGEKIIEIDASKDWIDIGREVLFQKDIKTIATKEQMKSIEYVVKE